MFLKALSFLLPLLATAAPTSSGDEIQRIEARGRTDWTVPEIVNTFIIARKPVDGSCVFYHGSFVTQARQFAFQNSLTTLYDVYRVGGTTPFSSTVDPMLSYVQGGIKHDWFEITSEAYATRCTGTVYLVWDGVQPWRHTAATGADPWTSIWLTNELPTLIAAQRDRDIVQVNPYTFARSAYTGPRAKREIAAALLEARDVPQRNYTEADVVHILENLNTDNKLRKRDSETCETWKLTYSCLDSGACVNYVCEAAQNFPNVEGSFFTHSQDGNQYVPGPDCGLSVNQKKTTNKDGGPYSFTVGVLDADGAVIGQTGSPLIIPSNGFADLASRLPFKVVIGAGSKDSDSVSFAYADEKWTSSSNIDTAHNIPGCVAFSWRDGQRVIQCSFEC